MTAISAKSLRYDGADERLMVGQTRDAKPSYYMVFVTAYNDGVIPERLQGRVEKGRALAQLVVISPDVLEKKMAFLNADDMKQVHSRFRRGGGLRFVLRYRQGCDQIRIAVGAG